MKIGIGSYSYPWSVGVPGSGIEPCLDQHGLLDRAIAFGVDAVQYCDNLPLTTLNEESLHRLLQHANHAGIGLEVGMRGIDDVDEFDRCVAIAQACGADFVRLVTDARLEEGQDSLRFKLRRLVGRLPSGVKIGIENHDSTPVAVLSALVSEFGPDRVGICLDTANSLGALEDLGTVARALAPFTLNVHVKDISIRRVWHQMGFEVAGTPAGGGMLPMREFVGQMVNRGFQGSFIVEHWPAPPASPEEAFATEDSWTQQSVAFLRSLSPPK